MTVQHFNVEAFLRGSSVCKKLGLIKQKFRWLVNLVNRSHILGVTALNFKLKQSNLTEGACYW